MQIVCDLADRVVGDVGVLRWSELASDYDRIRDLVEQAIPGFERFNERIGEGFTLPHPPRDERRFQTESGKARLTVNKLEVLRAPEGAILLQTIRSHDQYNTTIYALNDRYRGIQAGRRVVLVNSEDMPGLGVAEGDVVDLLGIADDGVTRRANRFRVVAYPTAAGCAAAYYPETNPLVPLDSVAEISGTPTSKSVIVRMVPSAPVATGVAATVGGSGVHA